MSSTRQQSVLVELSIAGDRLAFDALYRRWYARWYQFAVRHTDNPDIASDVIQDAALAMVKGIRRLRDPDTFVAWSFIILRRSCANVVRRAVQDRRNERLAPVDAPQAITTVTDPRLADLAEMVNCLDRDQQNLLTLFYGYGLSVRELAAIYDVPSGTIKSRLSKLREQIRSRVTHSQEDGV
ncbi:MAG: sigma-70 family RNA polymerase sigma factor [Pseudomonadota bacterium]